MAGAEGVSGGVLENPGGSFQDVDGLAALLLAVRLAALKVLQEEVDVKDQRWSCVVGDTNKTAMKCYDIY